ncbi:MAG: CBS domain-containing protein [Thaumarchaeota archaeon]|nr:CBS domain-containing protein [Nitrososphaerota archaeon]
MTNLIEPGQLKKIRVQSGLTQKGLANLAGVSQSIIAKIEAGNVDPTYSTLASISQALNSRAGLQGKKAASIMSHPVVRIHDGATLRDCVSLMRKKGFSQIPVFSKSGLVGIVSESYITDLLSSAPEPSRVLETKVSEHSIPMFPIVGTDTPVEALLSLLVYFPAVLVSNRDQIDGIITKIDLLTAETRQGLAGRPAAR